MSGRGRRVLQGVLIVAPVVMVALWGTTGRERLTKHVRFITVQHTDELFGGTEMVTKSVPGPRWTFGYYVGLDAVAMTAATALVLGVACWWIGRHRRHRKGAL